ncbi:hypothetical protein LTR85_001173 [Meristemomyces frigidus]|nr:hypothetical protein LTR85_001173 [Meristemomyces frigidus]
MENTIEEVTAKSQSELLISVTRLFEVGEYSDLTIVCGPRTFKVHKATICPRSEVFWSACRKGCFKEGEENLITLEASSSDPEADNVGADDPEAIGH